MIQLIVYTGFYWAVNVMERLLVVNSATACALPSPWISTLSSLRAGAKQQDWAQTADAQNVWLWWVSCSLKKTPSFLLGIIARLWSATVNIALGEEGGKAVCVPMLALTQILFDRLWDWAGEEAARGGGWWDEEQPQVEKKPWLI